MIERLNISFCRLLPAFLLMMLWMTLLRVVFQVFNDDLLISNAFGPGWLGAYLLGVRYDFSVLFPMFFVSILGLFVLNWPSVLKRLKPFVVPLFCIGSTVILLVSIADIPYFRFSSRRATKEVFDILDDSSSAFSSFIMEYWMFAILFIICIISLVVVVKKVRLSAPSKSKIPMLMMCLMLILSVNFGKPLTPKNASFYVSPKWSPLAVNTPMTLAYSFLKKQQRLEPKSYFEDDDSLTTNFNIKHQFYSDQPFEKRNVIIFVLESFSREYLIEGHPNRAFTPFLDSIMDRSMVFSNAFANGTTSSYGLMSILGGIPPFLDEPYFSSIYGSDKLYGIGSLLKSEGYFTSFFYGAEEDHYGFKKNMSLLGIDHYYSRKDYPGDDFDGYWGVYDAPFFEYAADVLLKQDHPVFATLFNISTHFPYMVPPELKDRLPTGTLPSHQSIAYTDEALRKFFEKIRNSELEDNCVFIFVADHWAKMREMKDKSSVGIYRIPLFVYDPSEGEGGVSNQVVQQVDIIPTILDILNYNGPWMSFGSSVFDESNYRFTFNEFENIYQIIDAEYVLSYDERREESFSLFNYRTDPGLSDNLIDIDRERALMMERHLRAVIQTYNNSLLENHLLP